MGLNPDSKAVEWSPPRQPGGQARGKDYQDHRGVQGRSESPPLGRERGRTRPEYRPRPRRDGPRAHEAFHRGDTGGHRRALVAAPQGRTFKVRRWSGADAPGRAPRRLAEARQATVRVHVVHEAGLPPRASEHPDPPRRGELPGKERALREVRPEVLTRPAVSGPSGAQAAPLVPGEDRRGGGEPRDLRQERGSGREGHRRARPRRDHARRPEPYRGADPSGTTGLPTSTGTGSSSGDTSARGRSCRTGRA